MLHTIGKMLPEQPVGGVASVSNVVKKHVQLLVIVKVGNNDCADRRGGCKSPRSYVLHERQHDQVLIYQPDFSKVPLCCWPVLLPYTKFRVAALQEKSVLAVPVAINNVCLPVTIEVSQCYSSAMLMPILHTFT